LVKLGFPNDPVFSGICTCHLKFGNKLYECPDCKTLICSLPTQCPICELQLVTPMHISKSYYYQYPLKPFDIFLDGKCNKCNKVSKYCCEKCKGLYCQECGDFVQNELNFCIYC
jgi:transcription initiation factor TFIIH subunit 2